MVVGNWFPSVNDQPALKQPSTNVSLVAGNQACRPNLGSTGKRRTGDRRAQWSCELLSVENDVGGVLGRLMSGDAVAERRQIDPGEHRFALPEHDRRQSEMQFVDQPGAKILTHRLDATTDLHVAAFGGELRLLQRRLDSVGPEDAGGAALHLDRIARMARQHEGRRVIGWIVAPPALPALVWPGTADRTEHIAAEDERAEPVHRTMC